MNTSRHAISLLARCRTAFRPRLSDSSSYPNCCFAALGQRRSYSSDDSPKDYDSLPSLPISNPIGFSMDLAGRNFKQINWCINEQGIDRDLVFTTNESAEEVLKFITKCISGGDFETLKEKFTPEALTKAESLVAVMNTEQKEGVVFPGASQAFFFSSELCHFSPWNFASENMNLILTYLGFLVNSNGQRAWLMTLSIPKEGESTLSDDFKVNKFDYSLHETPREE